ncbi:VOC family protein [Limoniibacter endophyticus]|uniref:VOC family protein n=1 Tax=Limoniibacter endophyticus TaxID=1565040 RepID=A0A8J3GG17_9HYPH|nr:VOC family protein [Limoniibacter endophyticus]GHC70345.1 VOC family protein [Limoniibacter endophyticus]
MSKISPCLWFDNNAMEAAEFYVDVFRRCGQQASIGDTLRTGPDDKLLVVDFTLAGTSYIGLNGGPHFKFNEAVSLSISCEDQQEVDAFWSALLEGGKPSQCGWLTDRFGLSWQVVPRRLMELHHDPDPARRARVMDAMMKMVKLDIAVLEAAAAG